MSAEGAVEVKNIAERAFEKLRSSWCGFSAGAGKFKETLFVRDLAKTGIQVLQAPLPPPDGFIEALEQGIDVAAGTQGRVSDPQSEEEPGKILHEMRNGYTPKEQLKDFKSKGYKVHTKEDGSEEVMYYGGGDTSALFIILVVQLARFKEVISVGEGVRYIEKMWPILLSDYQYLIKVADSSGYGLLDSIPRNLKGLFYHTEHDSDFAYTTEEGKIPRPPHVFLTNNCDYVASLQPMSWAAQVMAEESIAQDAKERYPKAKARLHELFWMRDEGYYAPLIGGDGQQDKIITSDAVEGLWLEVFPKVFADRVIERLKEPDMNTSLGIRSRSRLSRQFAMNGPRAYWGGDVWTHQIAEGATGAENYGHADFAQKLDEELFRTVLLRGCEETFPVDDEGRAIDYKEYRRGWRPVSNNPQLWAAAGAWARAVRYLPQAA